MPSQGTAPDLVLCSSARRALATLEILLPSLRDGVTVEVDPDLYGAGSQDLLDRLRRLERDVGAVMVVGHNPGLHDLAVELASDGDAAAMAQLNAKFPTAALATLDIGEVGWDRLGPGHAYLASLVLPQGRR